jgi:hypothetical protein
MSLRRKFFGLMLFLLVLSLGACADPQTATPLPDATATPTRQLVTPPTPAPGWKLVKRSTYQIALPDTWQEIKLQEDEIKNAVTAAQDNNPPLADILRTLLESRQYKGFIFYAADKNAAPPARTVAIARAALPPNQDLQSTAQTYAQLLPTLVRGAQVTNIQAPLKINGIDAAAFDYTISLVNQNAKLATVRGVQYLYVLDSGDAYLVTLSGDASDPAFESVARDIAETFAAYHP